MMPVVVGESSSNERQPLFIDGRRRSDVVNDNGSGGIESVTTMTRQTTSTCSRRIASFAILFTLTLERLAFYSLAANLFLFLNRDPLNWLSFNAMTASYVFTGVAYLTAIIGGWIADSFLGRFKTIIAGLTLYTIAYICLVHITSYGQQLPPICSNNHVNDMSKTDVSVDGGGPMNENNQTWSSSASASNQLWRLIADLRHPESPRYYDHKLDPSSMVSRSLIVMSTQHENCGWLIYLLLITIGFSVGTVRANIAPFGADQVENAGEDATRRFFNSFYWCINIGGFIALGLVAYIQQAYSDGFFIGYLIAAGSLGVAIAVFIAGRPFYEVRKPTGSVLVNVLKIMREAYGQSKIRRSSQSRRDIRSSPSTSTMPDGHRHRRIPSRLDMAKVRYGGSFTESAVDDVKALGKIIIVFIALVPFWVVYFQMQTSFIAQGLHMKLNPFPFYLENATGNTTADYNFTIPAAWLTLFDVVFLLILIPLMDRVVYPFLDSRNLHLDLLTRISLGMMFALAAVLVAGSLESFRLHLIYSNNATLIVQVVGNTTYVAADLWIFWQVPQYALIGISEVFASVASLEFAYSRSPKSMQGLIMGFHCLSTGTGSFVGILFIEIVHALFFSSRDFGSLNHGHLDYYFFLLAAIQFLTIILFNVIAKYCRVAGVDDHPSIIVSGTVDEHAILSSTEEANADQATTDIEPIFQGTTRPKSR